MTRTNGEHGDTVKLSGSNWLGIVGAVIVTIVGSTWGQSIRFENRMSTVESTVQTHEKRLDKADAARDALRTEILNELRALREQLTKR